MNRRDPFWGSLSNCMQMVSSCLLLYTKACFSEQLHVRITLPSNSILLAIEDMFVGTCTCMVVWAMVESMVMKGSLP